MLVYSISGPILSVVNTAKNTPTYTVKKVNDFPVPSRDGNNQTLSTGQGEFGY
jgi:hypothetical protein